jgi:arylsulfatase A-like enzyme
MSQPNILLITSDQHRYDCIGYANGYPVRTPSLDALAREGMSFLQAYSPIPTCCPARQAFLSGMRPEALNSYWNYDQGLPQTDTLDPKNAVWTNRLKELGYSSAYIGKWHVNPDKDPLDFGYGSYASEQDYKDFVVQKYGPAAVSVKRGMSGKGRGLLGGIDPLPLEDSHTHWLARRAIDRMEAFGREGKPWHIRLDFVEPHLPCEPVQQFYDLFSAADIPPWSSLRDGFENKPYIQRQQPVTWKIDAFGWEDWRDSVRRYYAAVAQMDDAIGRVLAYVRKPGLSKTH